MGTFMILALAMTTQDSSARHVRATEAKILTLIDAGVSPSPTFRGLIATLNESDVIVYIEPKLTRQAPSYAVRAEIERSGGRLIRTACESDPPPSRPQHRAASPRSRFRSTDRR